MALKPFVEASILIASPHMEHFKGSYVYSAMGLLRPQMTEMFYMGYTYLDEARSEACRKLLSTTCSHLLFIDSDMGWPADALMKLYEHDQDIVGGKYYMRLWPFSPVAYRSNGDEPETYRSIENEANGSGLLEVDMIGMGFTLIKRHVIEAFWSTKWGTKRKCGGRHTWKECSCVICERTGQCNTHELTHNRTPKIKVGECPLYAPSRIMPFKLGEGFGEDTFFCREAKKLGARVFVDLDIWCPHITNAAVKQKVLMPGGMLKLVWEPIG